MPIAGAFLQNKLIACLPDTTVLVACQQMKKNEVSSIVVLDETNNLMGIFTEHDLLEKVVSAELDPKTISISQVMSTSVTTVDMYSDIRTVIDLLMTKDFRHLPVIDRGSVVGVLSLHTKNLISRYSQELKKRKTDTIHALFKGQIKEMGKDQTPS